MLGSRAELNSYDNFISGKTPDIIAACKFELGGNGDMLGELEIEDQLNDIKELKWQLGNATADLEPGGTLDDALNLLST